MTYQRAPRRSRTLPPDGTIVTAMTVADPLGDDPSFEVTGVLETAWVDVFSYLQVVVDGRVVQGDTVRAVE